MRIIRNSMFFLGMLLLLKATACGKSSETDLDVKPGVGTQEEVNVTIFKGSSKNDHEMIQKAIDYASAQRIYKVYIPDGEYMISAAAITGQPGLLLRDNIKLRLSSGAKLRAIPNNAGNYSIVRIHNVSNVSIEGGTIIGERQEHVGTSGEWGMGIDIRRGIGVVIKDIRISDCWGDGIYIGQESKNLLVDNIVCDNNRRQGISVINCDGLIIQNSTFKNTNGAAPAAGIDLEPNENDKASNIQIMKCRFENNSGLGLHMYGKFGPVTGVKVEDCVMEGNPIGLSLRYAGISSVDIKNVTIKNSATEGLRIFDGAHSVIANKVIVKDSEKIGIRVENAENIELNDVTVDVFQTGFLVSKTKILKSKNVRLTNGTTISLAVDVKDSQSIEFDDFAIQGGKAAVNSTSNTNFKFTNSIVGEQSDYGMNLSNTHDSFMENNSFSKIAMTPVQLVNSNGNSIKNNSFTDNCYQAHNLYAQVTITGSSSRNSIALNKALASTLANKPKHVVRMSVGTTGNIVATSNTFSTGAYFTSPVQDDTNGANQTN
ncbi:right-handed parallel beta-helix repeat-containing protein [Pedobacter sp. ASV1-7]|uniref:right-handed parallel beta-helix repeat-containing protein n=1 Tax=Pedobacter sp. ASV1-7 TaxID=3145237 RepID=UPI0032E8E8FB